MGTNYPQLTDLFFNEVDTVKGTFLKILLSTIYLYNLSLFHFLASLTQGKELCSKILDSFFNELDTRQGTMLEKP